MVTAKFKMSAARLCHSDTITSSEGAHNTKKNLKMSICNMRICRLYERTMSKVKNVIKLVRSKQELENWNPLYISLFLYFLPP